MRISPINERQQQNQNQQQQLSTIQKQQHSPTNKIKLLSVQILKPQFDTSPYQKLTISIILHQLNDQSRKLVRYLSSKYAMSLYDDWQKYWLKQKELVKQGGKGKDNKEERQMNSPGEGQLIIVHEKCLAKVLREMKLNPTLRVVLVVGDMREFTIREEYGFVLVTDQCKEVGQYVDKIRKKMVFTAKG